MFELLEDMIQEIFLEETSLQENTMISTRTPRI